MPSSLNPNVKPFPAYIPTPIAPPAPKANTAIKPSTSPSIASSWSSRSKDLTLTSRSPTSQSPPSPFPTYQTQVHDSQDTRVGEDEGDVYPIKQFGHGWSSTPTHSNTAPAPSSVVKLTTSMSELLANHTPTPLRTRSPSMPILPSSTNTNIFASDSDPIVSYPSRDRYKHLQVPDRVSKYDSVNGHSYIGDTVGGGGRGLGHSPSVPNLTGNGIGQGQGYRRSSLVTSWREGIPEETEVDHLTPRYDTHPNSGLVLGQGHTLASSRSVPAFTSGPVSTGLSSSAHSTQSRNSKLPLILGNRFELII
jgi:hypothetical protein